MVNQRKGGRGAAINPLRLARPGENDILCGKDRACANHPGSRRFRDVIHSYRAKYMKAVTKYDKMMITKEIYEIVTQESRFLKYNDKAKVWEEITPLAGRDKIGHALRFCNREVQPKKAASSSSRGGIRAHLQRSASNSSDNSSITSEEAFEEEEELQFGLLEEVNQDRKPTPKRSKAELAASIVEASKVEPKVWDSLVGHIQNALVNAVEDGTEQPPAMAPLADPVALENIAYAVDTRANDAALDDLITMLNGDLVSEEQLQEVLGLSDEAPLLEGSRPPQHHKRGHSRHFSLHLDVKPRHGRMMSVDDDMWSVMKEPLMEWTGNEAAV